MPGSLLHTLYILGSLIFTKILNTGNTCPGLQRRELRVNRISHLHNMHVWVQTFRDVPSHFHCLEILVERTTNSLSFFCSLVQHPQEAFALDSFQ